MIDQLPLKELVTPAGIVLAGLLVRQVVEIAKKSFLPWLDAANERKGAVVVAAAIYVAWAAAYGSNLATDGWTAFAAFLAVAGGSIGANEGVDAARGQVAKNVAILLQEQPQLAALAGLGPSSTGAGGAAGAGAGAVAGAGAGAVAGADAGADAASASGSAVAEADAEDDLVLPLEAGPDEDLLVDGGEAGTDSDAPLDPAVAPTV
jgi:hypothetical protein